MTKESLKLELAQFLVEKNEISSIEDVISFRGIYKKQIEEKPENGIYVFNNGSSHCLSFFVIVDKNSFNILDISTLQGLKDSIALTLEFAIKQKYCTEITNNYISKLINVYSTINKNPRRSLDLNCEFELKSTKSIYDIKSLKLKLAEFLVRQNEIKNIDYYFKNELFLIIETLEMYYGIDKEKNINCGVYSFAYLNDDYNEKHYYVIVNEDWIEIFETVSSENLFTGINKILDFAENHKYCHLKTGQIIEKLIEYKYSESCYSNSEFKLP
ncbi:hypothetical protein [Olleya sp. R77988]|uniref:hypothetical protein n=1 Tax=Olleya sp. R77988 TaxID=3093875 RepID=UPI0037CA889C